MAPLLSSSRHDCANGPVPQGAERKQSRDGRAESAATPGRHVGPAMRRRCCCMLMGHWPTSARRRAPANAPHRAAQPRERLEIRGLFANQASATSGH